MLEGKGADYGQALFNRPHQDLASVGLRPGPYYVQPVFEKLNFADLSGGEFGVDGAFAARLVAQAASALLPIRRPIHSNLNSVLFTGLAIRRLYRAVLAVAFGQSGTMLAGVLVGDPAVQESHGQQRHR